MFSTFVAESAIGAADIVLDVGVTSDRDHAHSNFFEAWYPHKSRVTAAGIDDASFLEQLYPGMTFIQADGRNLPFDDLSFDFVHSNAVVEHVGDRAMQRRFIGELWRVARKGIFVTTPNRWFPVEFHTMLPLLHWLPPPVFRRVLAALGKDFFAAEENLNLLSAGELVRIAAAVGIENFHIATVALFGWPTNLLLCASRLDPPRASSTHQRPSSEKSPSDMQAYPGYEEAELEILTRFRDMSAQPSPGFVTDFLGVRHRHSALWPEARGIGAEVLGLPVPADFHAEAVEWIGMLKSVEAAKDSYTAIELGAGYGTWAIASGVAARKRGINRIKLYAVEGDPQHCRDMRQHFIDNGFDPDRHVLLQAAVGARPGKAQWPKVADSSKTDGWGFRPLLGGEHDYMGRTFDNMIQVEVLALADLLNREPLWDLVHFDVQGHETDLVRSCPDVLNGRVRWMVIGTHSRKIEGEILDLLRTTSWRLENEKPPRFNYIPGAPSLEAMTTMDGTQVWRNSRLS
jgi:FkbM family methyltransferase